jgi:hypothetical protein
MTFMRKTFAVLALLTACGSLGGCTVVQDTLRYLDEGPRNNRGSQMQRYWDHSGPGRPAHW